MRITRNLVVVAVASARVEVPREAGSAAVEADGRIARRRDGVAAHLECALETIRRRAGGNTRRDRIDHSADGAAAVEQRRRTAEDLDLVGGQRFDGDGVIVADGRGIHRVDAVLEHLHARARQTADDRPRCAGAEIRRAHADLIGQRLAERCRAVAVELVAGYDGDGLRELARRALVRHARDDELVGWGFSLRLRRRHTGAEQADGYRQRRREAARAE